MKNIFRFLTISMLFACCFAFSKLAFAGTNTNDDDLNSRCQKIYAPNDPDKVDECDNDPYNNTNTSSSKDNSNNDNTTTGKNDGSDNLPNSGPIENLFGILGLTFITLFIKKYFDSKKILKQMPRGADET